MQFEPMDKKEIEERLDLLNEKVMKGKRISRKDKYFILKFRHGLEDIDIEFILSGLPAKSGKDGGPVY